MGEKNHDIFQAISDPTRRKILKLLAGKELSVTAISEHFPMSRTAVSKHLRILSKSKAVIVEKVGRETRYQLQPGALYEVREWLSYFDQYWDNKLAILNHLVEKEEDAANDLTAFKHRMDQENNKR